MEEGGGALLGGLRAILYGVGDALNMQIWRLYIIIRSKKHLQLDGPGMTPYIMRSNGSKMASDYFISLFISGDIRGIRLTTITLKKLRFLCF